MNNFEGDMLRDPRRDVTYFNNWIPRYIEVNKESLARLPSLKLPNGIAICAYNIFIKSANICMLRYGRGDDIHSIKGDVENVFLSRKNLIDTVSTLPDEDIKEMYSDFDLDVYYYIISCLSFLFSIKAEANDFKQAFKAVGDLKSDSMLMRLYELLTREDLPAVGKRSLIYPKIYSRLFDVFEATESERPALMKKFLDGWYKSMRPAAWYNNDKGGEGAYFGYWCFEAALVVNLLNIDDSAFRDNIYYPKDLIIRL